MHPFCVVFHACNFCYCTFVTIFHRLFAGLFFNLPVCKRALIAEFANRFRLTEVTCGGCQQSEGDSVQIPFKKFLHGCRSNFPDGLRSLRFFFSRRISTSWPRGWSVVWCRLCTFMTFVPETVLVSSRTNTAPFLSTDSKLLLIFQYHVIPVSILSFLASEMFVIHASLHHRFQLLIVRHRYFLMNFHVVQF